MQNVKKRSSGFTVVEMAIYMGLLAVFLTILTNIFISVLDVQLESEATSPVEQDSRYIFSRLAYDISRAGVLVAPAPLGTQTNSLQLTIGGVAYAYALSGSNMTLTDGVGTDRLNSFGTTVSNLTFQSFGNANGKPTIKIAFTLTSATQRTQGPEVKNFQTTLGLR